MREEQVQAGLVDAAKWAGWLIYHTYDSRRSNPGFPDLVLVHESRRRIAFIECKGEKGRLSVDQKVWLTALASVVDGDHEIQVGIANPDTYDSWLKWIAG